jgi:hypothetical protein
VEQEKGRTESKAEEGQYQRIREQKYMAQSNWIGKNNVTEGWNEKPLLPCNSNRAQKKWVRKKEAEMDSVYCTIVRVFKYIEY